MRYFHYLRRYLSINPLLSHTPVFISAQPVVTGITQKKSKKNFLIRFQKIALGEPLDWT